MAISTTAAKRLEAASLYWLERRGLARADVREMLIAALGGAVSAAAGADARVLIATAAR